MGNCCGTPTTTGRPDSKAKSDKSKSSESILAPATHPNANNFEGQLSRCNNSLLTDL